MAAEMLTRLGFECSVMDLFGDADTHMICNGRVTKIGELSEVAGHKTEVRLHNFVVFSGGLEANDAVAEKLAQFGNVAFTTSESIKLLAHPELFNDALAIAGVDQFPLFRTTGKFDCPVVCKKMPHSGTATLYATGKAAERTSASNAIFQKFIQGESVSLIFAADSNGVRGLGGSEQLTQSLSWIGSISGLQLEANELQSANNFANAIVELSGLVGVFGIDFIRNENGLWPVDVNPRIPASAEIVGDHVMQNHLSAFGIDCESKSQEKSQVKGKLVVFNNFDTPIRFEKNRVPNMPIRHEEPGAPISIADVPNDGEVIEPGRPILTVLASGGNPEEVRSFLSSLGRKILGEFRTENG